MPKPTLLRREAPEEVLAETCRILENQLVVLVVFLVVLGVVWVVLGVVLEQAGLTP